MKTFSTLSFSSDAELVACLKRDQEIINKNWELLKTSELQLASSALEEIMSIDELANLLPKKVVNKIMKWYECHTHPLIYLKKLNKT